MTQPALPNLPPLEAGAEVRTAGAPPLRVAVARTADEHERGLMFRSSLGDVDGMLFVMATRDHHAFWMLNVQLPLDLAWIDGLGRVVDVAAGLEPCAAAPCPQFAPRSPAKYVLEVPGGVLGSRGIQRGSVVSIAWL